MEFFFFFTWFPLLGGLDFLFLFLNRFGLLDGGDFHAVVNLVFGGFRLHTVENIHLDDTDYHFRFRIIVYFILVTIK